MCHRLCCGGKKTEGRKTSLKSKTVIKAKKGKLKEKEEAVGRC